MRFIFKEIKTNIKSMKNFILSIIVVSLISILILSSGRFTEIENLLKFEDKVLFLFKNPNGKVNDYLNIIKYYNIDRFLITSDVKEVNELARKYANKFKVEKIDPILYVRYSKEKEDTYKGLLPKAEDKDNVIAIPYLYANVKKINIGDNFIIKNKTFKIIGFTPDQFYVSLSGLESIEGKFNQFMVGFEKGVKDTEKDKILSEISKILHTNNPEIYRAEDPIGKYLPMIIILMIFSIFEVVSVYNHILNMRKKRYFTYRFLGMKRRDFYKMITIEVLSVYTFSFMLSIIAYYILDFGILRGIFGVIRYSLGIKSVITVYLVFLLILLLFMFNNIRKYFSREILQSSKI